MGRVNGKVALITGAAGGLGRSDALTLAREGAKVMVTDIDDKVAAVVEEIEKAGGEAAWLVQDVRDEEQWKATVAAVEERFGGLDILVNNAGVVIVATPEETTLEQFRFANAVMSEGVYLGCKYAIPAMRRRGGGSIINMSSIASHLGFSVLFAYTAAKGAVRSMTHCRSLPVERRPYSLQLHSGRLIRPWWHRRTRRSASIRPAKMTR